MALATKLKVDPAVAAAYSKGESHDEGSSPFVLCLALEGAEVKLVASHESESLATIEAAFAKINEEVGDGSAAKLFLFKAADPMHQGHSRWTLVSYVPEVTPPKTKMLLAAARDDVKRNLEAARHSPDFAKILLAARDDVKRNLEGSRFTPDYAVSEKEDLTFAAYTSWRSRDRESAMSARELAMQTVMAETNAARLASGGKMAGMAQVPFKLDDSVVQACIKTAPKVVASPTKRAPSASAGSSHDLASPASHSSSAAPGAAGAAEDTATGEGSVSGAATGSPSTVLSPSSAAGGEGESSGTAPSAAAGASTSSPAPATPPEFDFIEMGIAGETVLLAGAPRLLGDSIEAHVAAIKASVAKEGPKAPAGSPSGAAAAKLTSPGLPGVVKVEPRYFLLRLGYTAVPNALPTLLYYCPEGTAPRNRMTYSTAKAAVIDGLNAAGVGMARTAEARDEEELNSALANMLSNPTTSPTAVGGGSHHASSASSGSSGSAGKLTSPDAAAGAAHGRTPSKPGFGGVALPGMGGFALPGMAAGRSPLSPSGGAAASHAAAGEGESGETGASKRSAGPGRLGGFALPGMSPPGAK